ncbi:MAG: MBL fold metallo-hydrolase, partial [Bacteroides sp.]|nr:MBL fold metallo-hydrolase [Bacteroides sp.]
MMLKVLGSSSSGNGYVLANGSEALLLEAGVRGADVKRALGFDLSGVAGCLITHEHGDHAGYVNDVLDMAIPVYASQGTIDALQVDGNRLPKPCRAGKMFSLGRFKILPFETKHDCAEPLGYYINHPETGNLLFATDTYYLPCTFA